MKKILILLMVLVILVGGGFLLNNWRLNRKAPKQTGQKQTLAQETSKIDWQNFKKWEQSRFGFMHPQKSYQFVKELGVHWQRPHPGPFIWNEIEEEKDYFNWKNADEYVQKSQEAEVLIMATIWPYADWDQKTCHKKLPNSPRSDFPVLGDFRGKPCDTQTYQKFVRALVERYDGDGLDDMSGLKYPIKYWEVINEPEMQGDLLFFKGEKDAGAEYLEVLKITHQAVKEADNEAKIINGGIAALGNKNEEAFWQKVLTSESKNYIDIISIHSISGPVSPATSQGGPDDLNLTTLKKFMTKNGLTQPVWLTEIQFGQMGMKKERSEKEWASYLIKVFAEALASGAEKLFYVGLDNMAPTAVNSLLVNCATQEGREGKDKKGEEGMDVEYDSKSCIKQAGFSAFKTVVEKINYAEKAEKIAEGQYQFTVSGKKLYLNTTTSDEPVFAEEK